MNIERIAPIVIGLTISSSQILASQERSELSKYLNQEELQKAASILNENQPASSTKAKSTKKSNKVSVSICELDQEVIDKVSGALRKLVVENDSRDNKAFQTRLKAIRTFAEKYFLKKLASYGQANRSDEQNTIYFAKVWKSAVNHIYREQREIQELQEDLDLGLEFDPDEFEETQGLDSEKKITYKTTLLNMLMRRKNALELDKKVQTLIENGADKNLHPEFHVSPRMQNQTEFPLKIALEELAGSEDQSGSASLRYKILKVLLNDKITYAYNTVLDPSDCDPLKPVIESLQMENNKHFVLEKLLSKKDYSTFDLVLTYLEMSNVFITEDYEDKISQIEDQIYCPILEKILGKMLDVRTSALSGYQGARVDNIDSFFSAEKFNKHMTSSNPDNRFGPRFRRQLELDYSPYFANIAEQIDEHRNVSDLRGEELQGKVIEWAEWAHFRNRVANHLNKFALSASNKAEKSNVIRLIRYTNIHNEGRVSSKDDDLFKELHAFGGKDIIFLRRNKYNWTPLMYAMAKKQSEGIQLYLRQAPHEVDMVDGVDNNILHLAFPLPEEFYQDENRDMDSNVLQLVGAHLGKRGVQEKTEEAIKAVITEKRIDNKHKVAALRRLSASNFTPVSLAAAMGFTEIYEYLVDFLKGEGEWNRDDHAHLDTHVEELAIIGLKNLLKSRHDYLDEHQIQKIEEEIESRQKSLDELLKDSMTEIYSPDSYSARTMLDQIMEPTIKILDEYETQKSTKRSKAPYINALDAAIKQMLNPDYVMVKVWDTRPVEKKVPKRILKEPLQEDTKKKKSFFSFGKKKKKEPEWITEYITETVQERYQRDDYQKSPLHGMKTARSIVKISYLTPVLKKVTEQYLKHHTSPTLLSADVVYKGLTENQTMDFFKQKFNSTVEKRMQKVIRDTLSSAGRLNEERLEEVRSDNRFDNMSRGPKIQSELKGFGQEVVEEDYSSDEDII